MFSLLAAAATLAALCIALLALRLVVVIIIAPSDGRRLGRGRLCSCGGGGDLLASGVIQDLFGAVDSLVGNLSLSCVLSSEAGDKETVCAVRHIAAHERVGELCVYKL